MTPRLRRLRRREPPGSPGGLCADRAGAGQAAARKVIRVRLDGEAGIAGPIQRGSHQLAGERQPGLVAQLDGVTVAVYAFDVAGDQIKHIWAVLNPATLRPWTTD